MRFVHAMPAMLLIMNEASSNNLCFINIKDFVMPKAKRELAHFGLARIDDKPRGEAEFSQTIPKYRANESRVKLAWLCRVQPIFNES